MDRDYHQEQLDEKKQWHDQMRRWVTGGIAIFVVLTCAGLFGCPIYNVWEQGLEGRAALARANQQKEILVTQARAEKEAADFRAQAIDILGKKAAQYPQYRQQEFIGAFAQAMENGKIDKIIYVPTEANIPIIEARDRQ